MKCVPLSSVDSELSSGKYGTSEHATTVVSLWTLYHVICVVQLVNIEVTEIIPERPTNAVEA